MRAGQLLLQLIEYQCGGWTEPSSVERKAAAAWAELAAPYYSLSRLEQPAANFHADYTGDLTRRL